MDRKEVLVLVVVFGLVLVSIGVGFNFTGNVVEGACRSNADCDYDEACSGSGLCYEYNGDADLEGITYSTNSAFKFFFYFPDFFEYNQNHTWIVLTNQSHVNQYAVWWGGPAEYGRNDFFPAKSSYVYAYHFRPEGSSSADYTNPSYPFLGLDFGNARRIWVGVFDSTQENNLGGGWVQLENNCSGITFEGFEDSNCEEVYDSAEAQLGFWFTLPAGSACGNGIIESGEECDDGNSIDTDACNNGCTLNFDDPPTCANDTSFNISLKESVSIGGISYRDSCNGTSNVLQVSCKDSSSYVNVSFSCPSGTTCADGACVDPASVVSVQGYKNITYKCLGNSTTFSLSKTTCKYNMTLMSYAQQECRDDLSKNLNLTSVVFSSPCDINSSSTLYKECVNTTGSYKDYYKKGTVKIGFTSFSDVCTSSFLKEYYCDNSTNLVFIEEKTCPGGVCISGKCSQYIPNDDCGNDADCTSPGLTKCINGTCKECKTNSDCSGGVCNSNNVCVGCINDDDCSGGNVCYSNQCVQCKSASDCEAGEVCKSDNTCCALTCSEGDECGDNGCGGECGGGCSSGETCSDRKCIDENKSSGGFIVILIIIIILACIGIVGFFIFKRYNKDLMEKVDTNNEINKSSSGKGFAPIGPPNSGPPKGPPGLPPPGNFNLPSQNNSPQDISFGTKPANNSGVSDY